ncbi:MAG: hypothetical protein WC528_03475 [Patescibacteria group bacterium]
MENNPIGLEKVKPKTKWLLAIIFGFLLFIITMLLLFLMSQLTGSDEPAGLWWTGVIIAILMTFISWLFARIIKPAGNGQALLYGLIWTAIVAGILLVIALPNGTTDKVFGQWSTYLVFVGVLIGPLLAKKQ